MFVVVVVPVLALAAVISWSGAPAGPAYFLVTGVSLVALLVLFSLYGKRRQRQFAARFVDQARGSDRTIVEEFVRSAGGFRIDVGIEALMTKLAGRQRAGSVFRVGPEKDAVAIEPIAVPFEPCPLDEAEDALHELSTAGADVSGTTATAVAHHGIDAASSRAMTRSDQRAFRRLRRNMRMKGVGWVIVGLFAFNCVIAALESWRRQRVTWQLVYWPALLVVMLWLPAAGGLIRGKQWFAVPGGVVLRKGHALARQWNVHVFDRRRSLLCVYRNFREQWGFAVADSTTAATGFGTNQEMTLLLRAWLSPLEPPPAEQLSDLA